MVKKIAINGFGRIGRTFLRILLLDKKAIENINVVAINIGPGNPDLIAQLFKYDTVLREFKGPVEYKNGFLSLNEYKIKILCELDPRKIDWKEFNIDWLVEASGKFTTREKANIHIKSGCKKVLITAPGKDVDITIIPGVNDNQYDNSKHNIVSLGSCTTNCFAPMVKVIKENFGLNEGLMTTIHAYTNNQVLLDAEHKDPRRARAAALNIIPTKTGAHKLITQLYPELEGKIKAKSIRVPIPVVSLVDFTFISKENLTKEKVNSLFEKYSKNSLKGILEYCTKPLVSSDFMQNNHSCIIDSLITQCTGTMCKIFGWYDNEFGYCSRLKDFLLHN